MPRYSKTTVLFISLVLGFATAHAFFDTPNIVGGGEGIMFIGIAFMIGYKIAIELFLERWSSDDSRGE